MKLKEFIIEYVFFSFYVYVLFFSAASIYHEKKVSFNGKDFDLQINDTSSEESLLPLPLLFLRPIDLLIVCHPKKRVSISDSDILPDGSSRHHLLLDGLLLLFDISSLLPLFISPERNLSF